MKFDELAGYYENITDITEVGRLLREYDKSVTKMLRCLVKLHNYYFF